jgi:hypothetical protein
VKLNSSETVSNLPALLNTERFVSATERESVNLIASSAIRFQFQKALIFITYPALQCEISDTQFCADELGEDGLDPSAATTLIRTELVLSKEGDSLNYVCLAISSIRTAEEIGTAQGTGRTANLCIAYYKRI